MPAGVEIVRAREIRNAIQQISTCEASGNWGGTALPLIPSLIAWSLTHSPYLSVPQSVIQWFRFFEAERVGLEGGYYCRSCCEGHEGTPYIVQHLGNEYLCCENALEDCSECQSPSVSAFLITRDGGDSYICSSCAENQEHCDHCGEWTHHEDLRAGLCSACVSGGNGEDDGLLHNHMYKPKARFARAVGENPEEKTPYLGVEIETDIASENGGRDINRDQILEKAQPNLHWYAKEDSSLDCGIEMVSHPATYKYWMEVEKFDWIPRFIEGGLRAYETTTCGLHIHISRRGFSDYQVFKLLKFASNCPNYLQRISRRRLNDLERWAKIIVECPEGLPRKARSPAYRTDNLSRHEAINVSNPQTIEFRLFRGTLQIPAIRRNIAWVYALGAFIKQAAATKLYPPRFEAFLRSTEGRSLLGAEMAVSVLNWSLNITEENEVCV